MQHKPQVRWWRQYDPIFWEDEVWDQEQEEWEIVEYLRRGGTLFGDALGDGDDPWKRQPKEVWTHKGKPVLSEQMEQWDREQRQLIREEEREEEIRKSFRGLRCCKCNRPMPEHRTDTCSEQCQNAIDKYREELFAWMGLKR